MSETPPDYLPGDAPSADDRPTTSASTSGRVAPHAPKRRVRSLRLFRKIHRTIGVALFLFFSIIALTGLMLGWKKHTGGVILPKTESGVSDDLATWLPFDSLHTIAVRVMRDSLGAHLSPELERIDARPQKGVVKFVFVKHFHEVQLDGTTGAVLAINTRTSDFIENIHDGSILDFIVETDDEQFKVVYISIMGCSLLGLTISGFWLWYGPRRIRRRLGHLPSQHRH